MTGYTAEEIERFTQVDDHEIDDLPDELIERTREIVEEQSVLVYERVAELGVDLPGTGGGIDA